MTTAELLRTLELRGERLILEDERLALVPGNVEDALFETIRAKREELKSIVRQREEGAATTESSDFELIKSYFPYFGQWATIRDGWTGEVWGVSPRGLMVRGIHRLIYTVAFDEVINLSVNKPETPKMSEAG